MMTSLLSETTSVESTPTSTSPAAASATSPSHGRCQSAACLLPEGARALAWLCCQTCGLWLHLACVGEGDGDGAAVRLHCDACLSRARAVFRDRWMRFRPAFSLVAGRHPELMPPTLSEGLFLTEKAFRSFHSRGSRGGKTVAVGPLTFGQLRQGLADVPTIDHVESYSAGIAARLKSVVKPTMKEAVLRLDGEIRALCREMKGEVPVKKATQNEAGRNMDGPSDPPPPPSCNACRVPLLPPVLVCPARHRFCSVCAADRSFCRLCLAGRRRVPLRPSSVQELIRQDEEVDRVRRLAQAQQRRLEALLFAPNSQPVAFNGSNGTTMRAEPTPSTAASTLLPSAQSQTPVPDLQAIVRSVGSVNRPPPLVSYSNVSQEQQDLHSTHLVGSLSNMALMAQQPRPARPATQVFRKPGSDNPLNGLPINDSTLMPPPSKVVASRQVTCVNVCPETLESLKLLHNKNASPGLAQQTVQKTNHVQTMVTNGRYSASHFREGGASPEMLAVLRANPHLTITVRSSQSPP